MSVLDKVAHRARTVMNAVSALASNIAKRWRAAGSIAPLALGFAAGLATTLIL